MLSISLPGLCSVQKERKGAELIPWVLPVMTRLPAVPGMALRGALVRRRDSFRGTPFPGAPGCVRSQAAWLRILCLPRGQDAGRSGAAWERSGESAGNPSASWIRGSVSGLWNSHIRRGVRLAEKFFAVG